MTSRPRGLNNNDNNDGESRININVDKTKLCEIK